MKHEITEEQIRDISYQIKKHPKQAVKWIKNWFPEAFKEDKKELIPNSWVFVRRNIKNEVPALVFYKGNEDETFGFTHNGNWSNTYGSMKDTYSNPKYDYSQATEQEVTEALTKEAIKRGLVTDAYAIFGDGKYIRQISSYNYRYSVGFNSLAKGVDILFDNGEWTNKVETITKEEAEKELGKKII